MNTNKKHKHAGMGGTFDRLHLGHKELINKALSISEKVSIGLTVDDFPTKKELDNIIYPYNTRKKELEEYLRSQNQLDNVSIVPLSDVFGPTISDSTIDCIVITDHTHKGAVEINQKRTEIGLKELPVIKANLITDDQGEYLSSTRIRKGAINRAGENYNHLFENEQSLSDDQKSLLKPPQGDILYQIDDIKKLTKEATPTFISLVGDITLATFLENNIPFNFGVYDGKTKRKPNNQVEALTIRPKDAITNHPGTISPKITDIYYSLDNNSSNQIVRVEGEEDLLAVPLVLLQPLESLVLYGQPDEGIVIVKVTEDKKEQLKSILKSNKNQE